jgi:hypothetical protein
MLFAILMYWGLLYGRLFVAGAEFEPDGGADEAEGGADLVGKEALEGEVESDVAVCEEDEGPRGDGGQGCLARSAIYLP